MQKQISVAELISRAGLGLAALDGGRVHLLKQRLHAGDHIGVFSIIGQVVQLLRIVVVIV